VRTSLLRLVRLAAFVTIVASQGCYVEDCLACEMDQQNGQAALLNVQQTLTWEVDCSTCRHATITATWTNPLENFGDVVLTVQGRCGDTKSQPQERKAPVRDGRVQIADLGIKNLCGEDAAIKWRAWVTNESQDPLTEINVAFECPPAPTATGSLMPSAVPRPRMGG
jgi:hypothetical protein